MNERGVEGCSASSRSYPGYVVVLAQRRQLGVELLNTLTMRLLDLATNDIRLLHRDGSREGEVERGRRSVRSVGASGELYSASRCSAEWATLLACAASKSLSAFVRLSDSTVTVGGAEEGAEEEEVGDVGAASVFRRLEESDASVESAGADEEEDAAGGGEAREAAEKDEEDVRGFVDGPAVEAVEPIGLFSFSCPPTTAL